MLKLQKPTDTHTANRIEEENVELPHVGRWRVLLDDTELDFDTEEEEISCRKDLSPEDIAFLKHLSLLANESSAKLPSEGESKLPNPPDSIADCFRSVLGDAWHYMDRPRVPTKHRYRKAYFAALMEAWFAWDPKIMDKVKKKLRTEGFWDEDVEAKMYYDPQFFLNCVPQVVLPPSQLYWRVRNVFIAFGTKLDNGKSLFNDAAWKKASNVLKEILGGYASDPPGYSFYMQKASKSGEPLTNMYGLPVFWCLRGTGLTESHHKQFLQSVGTWAMGVEMADAIRQEHRHRYNQRMSEQRRYKFPQLGHYDTWYIDKIQLLVEKNHNTLVFPTWKNSSDYINTDESFGVIPLQPDSLTDAVNGLSIIPKLSREQEYLALHQGVKLPFTPVTNADEMKVFSKMMLDDPSLATCLSLEGMAESWLRHVNGTTVLPKLAVYLRTYREMFLHNRRIKEAVKGMVLEIQGLRQLNLPAYPIQLQAQDAPIHRIQLQTHNSSEYNTAAAGTAHQHTVLAPTPIAATTLTAWPQPRNSQLTLLPAISTKRSASERQPMQVAGVLLATELPKNHVARKEKHGDRGPDKAKRVPRRCMRCNRVDCRGRASNVGPAGCVFAASEMLRGEHVIERKRQRGPDKEKRGPRQKL